MWNAPQMSETTIKSELRGLLTGLTLVAAAVLLAISVNLGIPGQSLLGSLRFHIAIPMLLLPIALFALSAWWRAVASLVLVVASLAQGIVILVGMHQLRDPLEGREPAAELSVMSFNVLTGNPTPEAARDAILARQPDIAFIMETPGIEMYLGELAQTFPYRAGCDDAETCDLSILSKVPLANVEVIRIGPIRRKRLVLAQAEIDGVAVTLVGLHLTKPYFDDASQDELRRALALIRKVEGPIILAGDFNAAAWSGDIAAFAAAAELVPPPQHPATWPVELGGLGVPIDNMFTRGPALIETIAAQPAYGSNHLGLLARVSLFANP